MTDATISAARGDAATEGGQRARLRTGFLVLLCGIGVAASGVTLVRAADDAGVFEFLGASRLSRLIDPVRLRPRYGSGPDLVMRPASEIRRREARMRARRAGIANAAPKRPATRRLTDARHARPSAGEHGHAPLRGRPAVEPAVMASAAGRRTMCVRTCDGFVFPLGTLRSRADLSTHLAACAAACPGAETKLYSLAPGQRVGHPANARSTEDGTPYRRLRSAFLFRAGTVDSCGCRPPGAMADHLPALLDPTLRRGDVIIDGSGEAQVYAGGGSLPPNPRDFSAYENSRALTRTSKAQVDKVMGTSLRRKIAADYAGRQRLAEIGVRAPLSPAREVTPARNPLIRQAAFQESVAPAGSGARSRAHGASRQGADRDPSGAMLIELH